MKLRIYDKNPEKQLLSRLQNSVSTFWGNSTVKNYRTPLLSPPAPCGNFISEVGDLGDVFILFCIQDSLLEL